MDKIYNNSRIMAGTIGVYCRYDQILMINDVIPHPNNPNRHPEKQIELLAIVIRESGWRNPITISSRSGYVVKGHGRLLAATLLGESFVPVEYQEYSTNAEELADLVADNRISELSSIHTPTLLELIGELDTGEILLEQTGYTTGELEQLLGKLTEHCLVEENENEIEVKKLCPHCGEELT